MGVVIVEGKGSFGDGHKRSARYSDRERRADNTCHYVVVDAQKCTCCPLHILMHTMHTPTVEKRGIAQRLACPAQQ